MVISGKLKEMFTALSWFSKSPQCTVQCM